MEFSGVFRHASPVDKQTHARLLRKAMAEKNLDNQVVADATGKRPRTVTNWRSGYSLPDDRARASLRRLLGPYDQGGDVDPVAAALERTELLEWRQARVLSEYQKQLHEQRSEASAPSA